MNLAALNQMAPLRLTGFLVLSLLALSFMPPSDTACPGFLVGNGEGGMEIDCDTGFDCPDGLCMKSVEDPPNPYSGQVLEARCDCGGEYPGLELGACCHVYVKTQIFESPPGSGNWSQVQYGWGAHGSCNYVGSCQEVNKMCEAIPVPLFPRVFVAGCVEWSSPGG